MSVHRKIEKFLRADGHAAPLSSAGWRYAIRASSSTCATVASRGRASSHELEAFLAAQQQQERCAASPADSRGPDRGNAAAPGDRGNAEAAGCPVVAAMDRLDHAGPAPPSPARGMLLTLAAPP